MRGSSVRNGALLAVLAIVGAKAQDQGRAAVQKALEGEYHLTKATDDKSDIVTAGSVLVLHKDKVLMIAATSAANPCMNTYKDGRIVPARACGVGEKLKRFGRFIPGNSNAPSVQTRNFVSGEKFWVTKIDVRNNGVVFDFFTDAIDDTRYIAALTIPFGAFVPSPEEALKVVREVITAEPSEDAKGKGDNQQAEPQQGQQEAPAAPQQGQAEAPAAPAQPAEAAPAPAEAAPAPIEAPPPPPADPVEVKVGQTEEQVVAALGQPLKKAKVGAKEIYFYKDLKVTFVNGKVKDVE
ncbi:MAG TPA: hypothetical protein VMI94_12315 [Bryobacteraceae bacterium]|nr:hypothetical protein [Bryobacteraceae bacterium]